MIKLNAVMLSIKPSPQKIRIMTPGSDVQAEERGHCDHLVNMFEILQNLLLYKQIYK